MKKVSILIATGVFYAVLHSGPFDGITSAASQLAGTFSGSGSNLLEGMGQSVGVVIDYIYSFRVFNDTPYPIAAAAQRITPVLGAKFSGEVKKSSVIYPFQDSGNTFYDLNLYLDVWLLASSDRDQYAKYGTDMIKKDVEIGSVVPGLGSAIGALTASIFVEKKLEGNSIYHKKISLGQKGDENVYSYRAYTDKGQVQGEYLGICSTTQEFVGVFYNNTNASDVGLSFTYDTESYRVTLESHSFNALNSTKDNPTSVRPAENQQRSFTFYQGKTVVATIPVTPLGIATMQIDPKSDPKNPKYIAGSSYTYTYEMYALKNGNIGVGMQGLSVGKYTQTADAKNPTSSLVRDITPVTCHFWVQSAEQYNDAAQKKDPNALPLALAAPGQLWVLYKTKDQFISQKLQSGTIQKFNLIRPLLSEEKATVYVVAVNTTEDKKAQLFLERLGSGILKEGSLAVSSQFDPSTLLINPQPNTSGIIDDSQGKDSSGVKGSILIADIFFPRGIGPGPYYYTIKPSLLDVDSLVQPLTPFLNTIALTGGKSDQNANDRAMFGMVQEWIKAYGVSNKEAAKKAIELTIATYGYDAIKNDPTLKNNIVTMLIEGPISLVNLPLKRQAGVNNYVYSLDARPDDWPA